MVVRNELSKSVIYGALVPPYVKKLHKDIDLVHEKMTFSSVSFHAYL